MAFVVVVGLQRVTKRSVAVGSAVVLCLMALLPTGTTIAGWLTNTEALSQLVGRTSGDDYLRTHFLATPRTYEALRAGLEEAVEPGSGPVLMLFEARGFGLGRRVIEDPFRTNWLLLSPLVPPDGCLTDPGFSYVLVNAGVMRWYSERGVDVTAYGLDSFDRYRRRCLEPVWRGSGYLLFKRMGSKSDDSAETAEADPAGRSLPRSLMPPAKVHGRFEVMRDSDRGGERNPRGR